VSALEQVPESWREKIDQEFARGADARAVDMPEALRDELARLRVTDAVVENANKQPWRTAGVLDAIVFGGVWLVGLWTCGRWLVGWIRSLFG